MNSRVTPLDQHLAARLRAYRLSCPGVHLASLARFLGITYQSYQALEGGKVAFRVSTLERLAAFFNVTLDEFVGSNEPIGVVNGDKISYLVNLLQSLPVNAAADVLRFANTKAHEHGVKR